MVLPAFPPGGDQEALREDIWAVFILEPVNHFQDANRVQGDPQYQPNQPIHRCANMGMDYKNEERYCEGQEQEICGEHTRVIVGLTFDVEQEVVRDEVTSRHQNRGNP